jgi:hypothetical protein
LAEAQEKQLEELPVKRATFMAWSVDECLEGEKSVWATTRSRAKAKEVDQKKSDQPPDPEGFADQEKEEISGDHERPMDGLVDEGSESDEELEKLKGSHEYWGAHNPPPNIHIEFEDSARKKWVAAYLKDPTFSKIWTSPDADLDAWKPGNRYFKNSEGLLFFRDADYQPRLCVPRSERVFLIKEIHESPLETAHAGPEKLWMKLSSRYYWPRMKLEITVFCMSCDVCQKIKNSNFKRFGYLIPNPIPSQPYESISMDFIVDLPWCDEYNAVLVIVCRLTKHAIFIPTMTGLDAEGFAKLFVKFVVCRFGLPSSIISDRDPRWTSDFWKAVVKFLKTRMALSSSHHPQHDGQTEIVNKQLEVMLRAYTAGARDSWVEWLHLLEFAYNSNPHASTGCAPYFLLYGFVPLSPSDFARGRDLGGRESFSTTEGEASEFLSTLRMHRESARLAIAKAQQAQAQQYNKGRRATPTLKKGDRILINPHSLEWMESTGAGAKLSQRWIGPFEVAQEINPKVYRLRMSEKYPGLPIFNVEHFKKYVESPKEFGERTTLPETRTKKPEAREFIVEKIIAHRFERKGTVIKYLVRWEGYGPQFDTWEPRSHFKNSPRILAQYRKDHDL